MASVNLYPSDFDAPEACEDMPIEQRLFGLSIMVLAAIPYVFVGAAVRWMVG